MQTNSESEKPPMVRTAAQAFCSNMSQGMHAMAQPLTILRAGFSLGRVDGMSLDELQEFTAKSALQIDRVCLLFGCMQQFIVMESSEPQLAVLPLTPLVDYAIEGINRLFQDGRISLRVNIPEVVFAVLVNRERTIQALSSVLLISHAVSNAEDTVEVIATRSSTTVQVVIKSTNPEIHELSSEELLTMALAEASLRSQHGSLSWTCGPFHARIELQLALILPEPA
jgi:hypothetical protein